MHYRICRVSGSPCSRSVASDPLVQGLFQAFFASVSTRDAAYVQHASVRCPVDELVAVIVRCR